MSLMRTVTTNFMKLIISGRQLLKIYTENSISAVVLLRMATSPGFRATKCLMMD